MIFETCLVQCIEIRLPVLKNWQLTGKAMFFPSDLFLPSHLHLYLRNPLILYF